MEIKGFEGISMDRLNFELERGAKFIVYQYCISIVFMTFKRGSKIHFIKENESRLGKGMIYNLISFVFGWWGIPWGPIYTIGSIFSNVSGGKDITQQVVAALNTNSAS